MKNFIKMSDKDIRRYLALEGIGDIKPEAASTRSLLVNQIAQQLAQRAKEKFASEKADVERHIANNIEEVNGVYSVALRWKVSPEVIRHFKDQGIDIVLAIPKAVVALAIATELGVCAAMLCGSFCIVQQVVIVVTDNLLGAWILGTILVTPFLGVCIALIAGMVLLNENMTSRFKVVLKK